MARIGRPPKSDAKTSRLVISVSEVEKAKVEEKAKRNRESISNYLRQFIPDLL